MTGWCPLPWSTRRLARSACDAPWPNSAWLAPAEEVEVVDDIGFDGGMGIGMGVGGVPQAIIDDAVPSRRN